MNDTPTDPTDPSDRTFPSTPTATIPPAAPATSPSAASASEPSSMPLASSSASVSSASSVACGACGTANEPGATFCEACGADIATGGATTAADDPPALDGRPAGAPAQLPGAPAAPPGDAAAPAQVSAAATPQTAPAGEESPLDVGWTGPVAAPSAVTPEADTANSTCAACGRGQIVDGYCDQCGTPPPDPRDHFSEAPAAWVGGVCDIGKRHTRNEDAMSLSASEVPGSRAVLVVCDGVTMATDSHIASLAAAKSARSVLDQPFPKGVGTAGAWEAGAGRALTTAVTTANAAVAATVEGDVPNPPSCTFAAAVVEQGVIVAGTVGDSRVYWVPDAADEPARQLGQDDSFAQEQITLGVAREEAETGPQAHAITRWLGKDSPDDLTPHLTTVTATPGWLVVCSDGMWNYCSDAEQLRALLQRSATNGAAHDPVALAQTLVDFANDQGGRDNITVALARLAGQGSNPTSGTAAEVGSEEGDPRHG